MKIERDATKKIYAALVNNLLGSRATVGHSKSLLSQRKLHRNCFRFSLFLSAFPTVFSRLPVQFYRIYISFYKTFLFIVFILMWTFFILLMPPFSIRIFLQIFLHQPFHFSSTLVSRDFISSQFIFFS